MKTETAVDYLVKEFSEILGKIVTNPLQDLLMVDAINKSKEKEKQQIIDAWDDGNTEAKFDDGIGCNANDYYAIKFNNFKD